MIDDLALFLLGLSGLCVVLAALGLFDAWIVRRWWRRNL